MKAKHAVSAKESAFDFNIPEGRRPLPLHSNTRYEEQLREAAEQHRVHEKVKAEELEKWRKKRWKMLASGKIGLNELHDSKP